MKSLICAVSLSIGTMFAAVITPADPGGWNAENVTGGGSVAITKTQPNNGNGSLEFNGTSSSSKADFTLSVTPFSLSSLSNFSIDMYRDSSSTVASHFAPAVRLVIDNGQATDRYSLLVWEPVYNNLTVMTDSWNTYSLASGNFWQRAYKTIPPNQTIETYNRTLADWLQAGTVTDGGGKTSNEVGPNAQVIGVQIGYGSGWDGTGKMFADNLQFGDTLYNFEDVPEPATFALIGAGLAGILALRRRGANSNN